MPGDAALVEVDLNRLRELSLDGGAYGQQLGASLLKDPVGRAYREAWQNALTLGSPLRVRPFVGPSAPELHDFHTGARRVVGRRSPPRRPPP